MKDQTNKVIISLKDNQSIETNLSAYRLAALHAAIESQRQYSCMNVNVDIDGQEIAVSEIEKVQCEESDI